MRAHNASSRRWSKTSTSSLLDFTNFLIGPCNDLDCQWRWQALSWLLQLPYDTIPNLCLYYSPNSLSIEHKWTRETSHEGSMRNMDVIFSSLHWRQIYLFCRCVQCWPFHGVSSRLRQIAQVTENVDLQARPKHTRHKSCKSTVSTHGVAWKMALTTSVNGQSQLIDSSEN